MEKIMGYAVLTLKRSDLERAGACEPWLKVFDEICVLRGAEKAPLARLKNGESVRKPSWLRVELTPLTQLWLARDGIAALNWLRQKGLMGPANLREADLSGADLFGADLSGADLFGADLSGATLYRATLSGATLSGASLYRADLSGADLFGADLSGASLRGAYLRGADLRGASLYGASLYGASLRGADLRGADLRGADLRGASLSGADLSTANRWPDDHALAGWELANGCLRRARDGRAA